MAKFFELLAGSAGMIVFFAANFVGLLIIPFSLPGIWVQVAACAALTVATRSALLGWKWVALFVLLGLIGEGIEFLSGRWGAKRFGGSSRAGWCALAGGIIGLFFGLPVPIIGSLITSFIGTFAGAVLGEMWEQKSRNPNLHVGFGAVLGRVLGTSVKMSLGFVILLLSVASLAFGW